MTSNRHELRIGVTGHREIGDPVAVRDAVNRLLDHIAGVYIDKGWIPVTWTAVSPLAKGADQIFARVMLDRFSARLEVITPFPLDEYRQDFVGDDESTSAFENLLAEAGLVTELDGNHQQGFRDVGLAVVDTSEIVVSIWDGQPSASSEGAAAIIAYALQLSRVVLWIDSLNPGEAGRLLVADSDKNGMETSEAPRCELLTGSTLDDGDFGVIACRILPMPKDDILKFNRI